VSPIITSWRSQNNIPDSDGFEAHLQGNSRKKKKKRSATVSRATSDKHNGKMGYEIYKSR
jgi:hypothetical protein